MEPVHAVMHPQVDVDTKGSQESVRDNDDSDSENSQEETPTSNWNELSIIDRVGLNSVEISEIDLEKAFSQIALAFRCDQYTLKQRLQAEEHARNLAEENIQLELSRGRETLEEARVSRAVDLMVAHVENVRRRLERHESDLEEAKKMIQQQNSCRTVDEPGAPFDPDESGSWKKSFQQNGSRRRVSVSLIPSDIQKTKRDSKERAAHGEADPGSNLFPACPSPSLSSASSCSGANKDDGYLVDDRPIDPDEVSAPAPPRPTPIPELPVPCRRATGGKVPHKSCALDTTRQRHKSKVSLAKKKADKEKKRTNISRRISEDGSLRRQRPFARCRCLLLCVFVLLAFITWIFLFV
ncbi:inositol 1,4,5-triphosphate receptor associated 2 isoform X3 [Phycodurus eques]|uniref:inositol 1,4,5-triphosphate receptor associated 2 isoform X3 n=1 Tax=Phycodurus eques TaxID=693459 RepID=UPI002ACEBDAD|nr:inositol 1,4,5-triphosphate receptor associated 2 isoform X3 [Phycodurus eques]